MAHWLSCPEACGIFPDQGSNLWRLHWQVGFLTAGPPEKSSNLIAVQFTISEFWGPDKKQWHPTPVLLPGKFHGQRSLVGCSPWGSEESDTTERFHLTFHFLALEKEMAAYSSVLAWRIPGTGEPGGLPSMGSHRVRHDWSDLAAAAAACGQYCSFVFCFKSTLRRHSKFIPHLLQIPVRKWTEHLKSVSSE